MVSLAQSSSAAETEDCRLSLRTAKEQSHGNNQPHAYTSYILRSRKNSDESWLSVYTWALWAAGVLCAGGVLTKKRWTDFSLTQDTSTVACTLCARINIPCLSFYKVFPTRSMTD